MNTRQKLKKKARKAQNRASLVVELPHCEYAWNDSGKANDFYLVDQGKMTIDLAMIGAIFPCPMKDQQANITRLVYKDSSQNFIHTPIPYKDLINKLRSIGFRINSVRASN